MSHEAVTWAMRDAPMLLTTTGHPDATARYVLQVLAEFAEKDGTEARPSIPTIRYRTGLDRSTVQRALRRLEGAKLINPVGMVHGCTNYTLAMSSRRPASDWDAILADEERRRAAAAERKRKSRASDVTDAESVTVTDAECVTDADVTHSEDVTPPDVTHSARGRHALEVCDTPDVTHSAPGRHALNAAQPVLDPSLKEEQSKNPSGDDSIPGQTCLIEAAAEAVADKPRRAARKPREPKPKKPNPHQLADDLAAAFWKVHGTGRAQPFISVKRIIRAAIANGCDRDDLARALDTVAREGRSISGGTLDIALARIRNPQTAGGRPGAGGLTDDQWQAAYERAQARDAAAAHALEGQ